MKRYCPPSLRPAPFNNWRKGTESVFLAFIVMAVITSSYGGQSALAAASRPAMEVPNARVTPRVDADPSDPAWKFAATIPSLTVSPGRENPVTAPLSPLPTEVKLLWDKTFLYIRFLCEGGDIYVPVTGHDKELYKGDVVEVFIDPVGDAREYVEIEISPKNDVFDQILLLTAPQPKSDSNGVLQYEIQQRDLWAFPQWDVSGLRSAAKVCNLSNGKPGWIVDLAIPAKSILRRLGVVSYSAMTLRVNLLRYEWSKEPDGSGAGRKLIAMNWAPVQFGLPHLSPQAMGELHLAKPLLKGTSQ
jgi:hypothetical protein